jgi:copper chaperone
MCGCTNGAAAPQTTETVGRTFAVTGMTCQPCAAKVTDAVQQVTGITTVTVDLAAGRLIVAGTAPDTAIRGAVSAAGYQIADL